jgi:CheY-like chemotaxis protein
MVPQPVKPRVLIVDDHPANRRAFESVLENDFTVTLAGSGPEALQMVEREEYAVIILDVRMPGMDGFEVAERLRMNWAAPQTPIIFTSAYDQNLVQIKKGFVAGATDFLFSPVDGEVLLYKVTAYATLFLRYESVNHQLTQLKMIVDSILLDAKESGLSEGDLRDRMTVLEIGLSGLQRQLAPMSG